jgi:hypothetical protein
VSATLRLLRERPEVAYSYSCLSLIDAAGALVVRSQPVPALSRRRLLLHFNVVTGLECFTRSLHRRVGGFSERAPCEDYDRALRCSEMLPPGRFAHHRRDLSRCRVQGESRSRTEAPQTRAAAAGSIAASLLRRVSPRRSSTATAPTTPGPATRSIAIDAWPTRRADAPGRSV